MKAPKPPLWIVNSNDEEEERQGGTATVTRKEVKKAPRWKVLFHNDNYTTMEFVILVLRKFFRKSDAEATHIMLSVHHKGMGVAGVYSRDIAETKVSQVTKFARANAMPLKLTAEPELSCLQSQKPPRPSPLPLQAALACLGSHADSQ